MQTAAWGNLRQSTPDERAAVRALARGVALALQDSIVRAEVKTSLAQSATREQKLHFSSFLEGRGARLIAASAARGGMNASAFRGAIARARDLEFYMPVEAHRSAWAGGAEILVVGMASKQDSVSGYTVDGEERVLSRETAPNTPVLVLTQVETEFGQQPMLNRASQPERTCAVPPGSTLLQAAAACESSAGVAPPSKSAATYETEGLRITYLTMNDLHESWWQGDPEVEAHAMAKRSRADGTALQFQCAGEHAVNAGYQPGLRDQAYVFDMNANTWSGDFKILNPAQIDTAQQAENAGFNVVLYEDDQIACEIRDNDEQHLQNSIRATAQALASLAVAIVGRNDWLEWGTFGAHLVDAIRTLNGDDTYLGVIVDKSETEYANQFPDRSHVIMRGATLHGQASMDLRTAAPTTAPVAQVFLTPYPANSVHFGTSAPLAARGYDISGRVISGRPVAWASSNPSVLTVGSDGMVTGISAGTASVTATIDGVQSTRSVKVTGNTAYVTVSPASSTISLGGYVALYARAYDSAGNELSGKLVTWTSQHPEYATVDSEGGVTGSSTYTGYATITATIDGVVGSATVEVASGSCIDCSIME